MQACRNGCRLGRCDFGIGDGRGPRRRSARELYRTGERGCRYIERCVAFDGTSFLLSATLASDIDAVPGQLYAWGIDRGAGTPRIDLLRDPDIAPDIVFDAVLVMLPNGVLTVVTIPVAGAPTFTTVIGGTVVNGDTLSATIPLSLLFSTGFAPEDYTFGFWSRIRVDPTVDGTNNEIADFLLGSGTINARVVPEPATWLTMLLGFGVVGSVMRRGRKPLRVARPV